MDATLRNRLINRLVAEIDDLPPQMRLAAKYIVDNARDFGLDPIRESAGKIGISTNSLVRLATKLGFESFEDLRAPFRSALLQHHDVGDTEGWITRLEKSGSPGAAQARAVKNELNVVGRSLRLLSVEKAEAVIEALTGARRAYVTATRASYALAYFFHYAGRMALPNLTLIPRHIGTPVDEMLAVGKGDVLFAITFQPYSAETIDALRFARKRGATVVLMSDSPLIAPGTEADIFLEVATQSTHFFGCFGGAMAVLECLLAHLVRAGGNEATERIAAYEALRDDYGAYWRKKLPRVVK